jgi:hypothetical protein
MVDISKIQKEYENIKTTISKKEFLETLAKSSMFITEICFEDEEDSEEIKAKVITAMALASAHAAKKIFSDSNDDEFGEVNYSEKEVE